MGMAEEVNLSDRLSGILEEIKDVMEQRRQRIEELRQKYQVLNVTMILKNNIGIAKRF